MGSLRDTFAAILFGIYLRNMTCEAPFIELGFTKAQQRHGTLVYNGNHDISTTRLQRNIHVGTRLLDLGTRDTPFREKRLQNM